MATYKVKCPGCKSLITVDIQPNNLENLDTMAVEEMNLEQLTLARKRLSMKKTAIRKKLGDDSMLENNIGYTELSNRYDDVVLRIEMLSKQKVCKVVSVDTQEPMVPIEDSERTIYKD